MLTSVLAALAVCAGVTVSGSSSGVGLTWQPPNSAANCTLSKNSLFERFTCVLPAGTVVGPDTVFAPQLRVAAGLDVFFSPSWNAWSASGSGVVYAAVPSFNTSFFLVQLLNSTGMWLDACPLPTWGETLVPAVPDDGSGAPAHVPTHFDNATGVGYSPRVPVVPITLRVPIVVSDAVLLTRAGVPDGAAGRADAFVQMYAAVLPSLVPAVLALRSQNDNSSDDDIDDDDDYDWHDVAVRSAEDLWFAPAASVRTANGAWQLRAYWNDSRQTSEFVTQLDVLTSLLAWNPTHPLAEGLASPFRSGAISYFHDEIGCVADSTSDKRITASTVLDGWYVLFQMGKLVDLAALGEGWARALLMSSIDHIIWLGRSFGYAWPVQYLPVSGAKVRLARATARWWWS